MASSRNAEKSLFFATGEIIHEDEPYACVLSCETLETVCSYCIGRSSTVNCNKCEKLFYCSKKCKRKDQIFHDLECKVLQGCKDEVPDEESRLVVRALDRYIRERDNNTISEATFFNCTRTVYDLLSHIEDMSPSEIESAKSKATSIMALVTPFVSTHLEELLDLLQRCRINCHSIVDHNDFHFFSRGRAVYLAGSKTNHTCVTSNEYVQMFNGRKILLRAIRDMEIDDPFKMGIHYMPPTLPYKARLSRCLNNYYFICSCKKCVWQARNPEPMQVDEATTSEIEQAFEEYHSFEKWYDMGKKMLEKLKDFPDKNFYVYWLLIQMQPTCFELGKYKESIEYGIRATNGAESILSLEPVFYYLCHAMTKLGWHKASNPNQARFNETYKLTKTLYTITHGPNHRIVQGLRKMRGTWWKKGSEALYGLFKREEAANKEALADKQTERIEINS